MVCSGTQARKSCANLQALLELTDYGHTMAKSIILCDSNWNTTQSRIIIWFCRNDGWLMENMGKGLKLLKWVLTNRSKIPWTTQKISAQFVCLNPKVWYFWKNRYLWVSIYGHSPCLSCFPGRKCTVLCSATFSTSQFVLLSRQLNVWLWSRKS